MFPQHRHDFLDDAGSISIEYALAMLIGATLAGLLIVIARSESVREGLTDLVQRALDVSG